MSNMSKNRPFPRQVDIKRYISDRRFKKNDFSHVITKIDLFRVKLILKEIGSKKDFKKGFFTYDHKNR